MDVELLPLVSRWLHILAALILVGGTVFLRWTVVPIMNDQEDREAWFTPMRARWSKLVMLSVLILLVSGLYNTAIKSMGYDLKGPYLILLSIKILLAFAIFFLVSVLSGRSSLAVRFRAEGAKWYNLTIVAMVLLICIAGYMKMTPVKIKEKAAETIALVKNF